MDATCAIRLTRRYPVPQHEVWAALTEPESLARWLAPPGEVDFSPGGAFELRTAGGETLVGRVRSVEPGHLLELDWVDSGDAPSIVRFELTGDDDGTVLVVDHRRIDALVGMGYLARWERHLKRLDDVVGAARQAR